MVFSSCLGGERGGQPQAIAPCGNIGGASDQCGVTVENLLRRRTVDHTEVDGLPGTENCTASVFSEPTERHARDYSPAHRIRWRSCRTECPCTLFGRRCRRLRSKCRWSGVLHICTEPFAKAINVLSHSKTELNRREHVGFIVCGRAVHGHTEFTNRLGGHVGQAVQCETSQGLARRLGEPLPSLPRRSDSKGSL